jgi:hypothetical protein
MNSRTRTRNPYEGSLFLYENFLNATGARVGTTLRVFKNVPKPSLVRAYYRIHGHCSPSGQLTSPEPNMLSEPRLNARFTFVFSLYKSAFAALAGEPQETRMARAIMAAVNYAAPYFEHKNRHLLNADRAIGYLVLHAQELARTGDEKKCSFRLAECRKCGNLLTVQRHILTPVCSICAGNNRRGRRPKDLAALAER